jgi:hypothetical protein
MSTVLIIFWLTCCVPVVGILGFWFGRCARRIPIIDNHLPWAMRHYLLEEQARDESTPCPRPETSSHGDCPDRYGSCSSLSWHLVGVGVPALVGLLGLVLVVTAP